MLGLGWNQGSGKGVEVMATGRWGRGFLRAWILISGMWVTAIAGLAWESFPKTAGALDMVAGPDGRRIPAATVESKAAEWEKAGNPENASKLREYAKTAQTVTVTVDEILAAAERAKAAGDAPAEMVLREKAEQITTDVRKRQNDALKQAGMTGLLPPLGLLILGVAVAWVLRGFRSAP